jgi:hypothetical protein
VLEIAANDQDPLRWQAVRALSSQPFASELGEQGLFTAAAEVLRNAPSRDDRELAGLMRRFDEQSCAYLLFEGARHLPEDAAAACLPLASDPQTATRLVRALLRTVFLAGSRAGPATVTLFCTVVNTLTNHALAMPAIQADENAASVTTPADEHTVSANNTIGVLYGVDATHALNTLVKMTPAHAADAIRVWFAAAEKIAKANGGRHAFDTGSPLPYQQTGLDIFETCATNAPIEFIQAVLPLMLTQFEQAALPRQRWRPARTPEDADAGLRYDMISGFGPTFRSLGDEVYDGLCTGLRLCAAHHPQVAISFIKQLTTTDLLAGHQFAAAAFGACAPSLLDDALRWAANPRVRGLPRGSTVGWAWGEVLAHLAAIGTDEQRDRVMTLALAGYEDLDLDLLDSNQTRSPLPPSADETARETRAATAEQLIVLSLVTRRLGDLTPSDVRDRQMRLEQKLGPAPGEPTVDPAQLAIRSPVPDYVAHGFGDDEWLDTIRTYSDDPLNRPDGPHIGGAAEIALQLEVITKAQPGRFARLVTHIGPDVNSVYVTAILRGLTSAAQSLSNDDVQAALTVTGTIFSWPQCTFRSPLCSLIAALADRDLPDDILIMVATMATQQVKSSAGEDDVDLMTAGMNNNREQAVRTLTYLLAPATTRERRVRLLLPTLQAVLDDPDESVRVMLPPAIVRTYLIDQSAALGLAEQWLMRASDAALDAPELDRIAWQLLLSRPQAGTQLLQRMIQSSTAVVRTRGGALAALTSLRQNSFPGDQASPDALLRDSLQDPAARRGAAALLAQLVDELPDPPDAGDDAGGAVHADRQLLIDFLNDNDEAVREAAANYSAHLAQPLSRQAATLLAATATSPAFAEYPTPVLHMLAQVAGHLPVQALDLCEHWLNRNFTSAGDIQTAAAANAYYVVEIVLAIHARATVGSTERQRCLALIDRLIEAGAADADKKADILSDS